jgi:pyrrolidone-carboxylate peptidase
MDSQETERKKRVIVTGFGPFSNYEENPSGVVAERLQDIWTDDAVELITTVMPVAYADVSETVDRLWTVHKPCVIPSRPRSHSPSSW